MNLRPIDVDRVEAIQEHDGLNMTDALRAALTVKGIADALSAETGAVRVIDKDGAPGILVLDPVKYTTHLEQNPQSAVVSDSQTTVPYYNSTDR